MFLSLMVIIVSESSEEIAASPGGEYTGTGTADDPYVGRLIFGVGYTPYDPYDCYFSVGSIIEFYKEENSASLYWWTIDEGYGLTTNTWGIPTGVILQSGTISVETYSSRGLEETNYLYAVDTVLSGTGTETDPYRGYVYLDLSTVFRDQSYYVEEGSTVVLRAADSIDSISTGVSMDTVVAEGEELLTTTVSESFVVSYKNNPMFDAKLINFIVVEAYPQLFFESDPSEGTIQFIGS